MTLDYLIFANLVLLPRLLYLRWDTALGPMANLGLALSALLVGFWIGAA